MKLNRRLVLTLVASAAVLSGAKQVTILFGLMFTAAACIIMGAAVPTTPAYSIVAAIVTPALAGMGMLLILLWHSRPLPQTA